MTESSLIGVFVMVFGGCFLIAGVAIQMFMVRTYTLLQGYQAGRCRIVAKRLLKERVSSPSGGGYYGAMTTTTMYAPEFDFIVQTVDGQEYQARGYEAIRHLSQFPRSQQAIVDQYIVGEVYPCWYDPADPTRAVLTLQFSWWHFVFPIPFVFIGGIALLAGVAYLIATLVAV